MEFSRIFDTIRYQHDKYPKKDALNHKTGSSWQSFSTETVIESIDKVSLWLLKKGVKQGDKIGILFSTGNPLWIFLDFGIQQIGAVPVPIHTTINRETLHFIMQDADMRYCFTYRKEHFDKIGSIRAKLPLLEDFFLVDEQSFQTDFPTDITDEEKAAIDKIKNSIQEQQLATIIYTSGTTGKPKGVMLSHKNMVSNIKSILSSIPLNYKKTVISFLPLSHIFERMVNYTYIAAGTSIYYSTNLTDTFGDIKQVRPHYFTAVPRILEKFYEDILAKAGTMNFISRRITLWAIKKGELYDKWTNKSISAYLTIKLAGMLVYRKWRKALGGRIKGVFVGGAALQPEMGRLYCSAGIKTKEGYGMTETSPIIAFNRFEPGGTRFGTVGIPLPGIEVKLKSYGAGKKKDGEILVRGPNVMMGYYNNPEATAKAIDKDDWFHTGDVGTFVDEKFLKITGRVKDLFKTSHGKYVSPQELEKKLNASKYINQSLVIGANLPFITALIVPSFATLKRWCEHNNVHWTAPQFMVINPKVEQHFMKILKGINEDLEHHEQIKKIILLHEEWSIANHDFTATMKLRRKKILADNEKAIRKIYGKVTGD